jgi:hypothetical protein
VKRILSVFIVGSIICTLVVGIKIEGKASKASNEKPFNNEENGLALSNMQVKITAMNPCLLFALGKRSDVLRQFRLSSRVV